MKNIKKVLVCFSTILLSCGLITPLAADPLPEEFCPGASVDRWTCTTGDGRRCDEAVLGDLSSYRQILVFPTGYQDRAVFELEADTLRKSTTVDVIRAYPEDTESEMWSSVHRERLLFLTYWIEGGPVGSEDAVFGGRLAPLPVREGAQRLKHDEPAVDAEVEALQEVCPGLDPISVVALFEEQESFGTANATPPIYMKRAFGIARISNKSIFSHYVGPHELGHSAMGWLDEYIEGSLRYVNVHELDRLTPILIMDQGLGAVMFDLLGVYDMSLSEMLFSNGADNVSLVEFPGRVRTPAGALGSEPYLDEGAYFGYGIYRFGEDDENLMGDYRTQFERMRQSPVQVRLMNSAFGTGQDRTNDRLVNAGPPSGFNLAFGPKWQVMLFDEDKNHRWHPTQRYEIEVQWTEQNWVTCRMTAWPYADYPCLETTTKTVRKYIDPTADLTSLDGNALLALGNWAIDLLCQSGDVMLSDLGIELGIDINICEVGGLDNLLESQFGTLSVHLPYQFIEIPTPRPFTEYLWRFRSNNSEVLADEGNSGWTEWSRLTRGL